MKSLVLSITYLMKHTKMCQHTVHQLLPMKRPGVLCRSLGKT